MRGLLLLLLLPCPARAQMVTGREMPGFGQAFGLTAAQASKTLSVVQIGSSLGSNVLWPGETGALTFRVFSSADAPLAARGRVRVVAFRTSVPTGDIWVPHVFPLGESRSAPVSVSLPAHGFADVTVRPSIPARFGGYALVFDFGTLGRVFGAAVVRTVAGDRGRVQFPTFALDMPWPFEITESVSRTFFKLGTKACRMGASYTPTTSPNFERDLAELTQHLKWAQANDISVMLTVGAGSAPQPLGRGRPWLKPDGTMLENVKEDLTWLPEYDEDFQKWTKIVATRFGWPGGPVNALELWNEPWEGVSISGWGADGPRYRELYEKMALGVRQARREANVKVLTGGASSSSNTWDKLFPDGSDKFLPWLDFVSIHYQEMSATPSLVPEWMNRKGENGRVKVWDTESWVANSEDRLAAVIASMRAQGQDRTVGIYGGNVFQAQSFDAAGKYTEDPGKRRFEAVQAWPPAAAVAATQKFIGQRPFRDILFPNGLPWAFRFDGLRNADDGTLVVVGDLGGVYNRNRLLFRSVLGLKNRPTVTRLQAQLDALPATAKETVRTAMEDKLKAAQVLHDATLTLPVGAWSLFDFYGNPVPASGGKIVVPLNGLGYFLRPNGSPGSFARLVAAVKAARVDGLEPIEIVVHDPLMPVVPMSEWRKFSGPNPPPHFRLTLTNVLNRPVHGLLRLFLGREKDKAQGPPMTLAPHQTLTRNFPLFLTRPPEPDNTYPVTVTFDAGKDGKSVHSENLHVNVISKKTITVDGKLDDWTGVQPQPVSPNAGIRANLTERAWLPFAPLDKNVTSGLASGYVAYDDDGFCFAAKIADSTPYAGNVRFATRDDDRYFYPDTVRDKSGEKTWPAGVRHFSYRRDPDLPSGSGTDNVQLAFNVVDEDKKPWRAFPPGTMPRFMAYRDTDYEYALNAVAPEFGGGTEVWRLLAPGVPRKHFYPRQPKAPTDGGPVSSAQLVLRRDGNTRIVEARLPWSEIPLVKKRLDAGLPVKFTFRVNDNDGPAYELAAGRSVSKDNGLAFHNDWQTHWANELEFAFERPKASTDRLPLRRRLGRNPGLPTRTPPD